MVFDPLNFYPVDVQYVKDGITIVSHYPHAPIKQTEYLLISRLLYKESVVMYPKAILNHISQSNSGLFGSTDASLKHGRATHA